MKRKGHFYEQIIALPNLERAAHRAAKGKRDREEVQAFMSNLENEIALLHQELQEQTYKMQQYQQFKILDPKERLISAAHFRDRVVHHAICDVIEPYLESFFINDSYACRKGKGTHRAIRRAQEFTRKFQYFLKTDIRKFFDSIPHFQLEQCLVRKFKDPELLWLFGVIIDSLESTSHTGIPIGNLTSQYFANMYLNDLDHLLKDQLAVPGYVRYMDDFVLFADQKQKLHEWHAKIIDFLKPSGLVLKPQATQLRHTWEGLSFLGCKIFPGMIRIKRENWKRFKKKFLASQKKYLKGAQDEQSFFASISSLVSHIQHCDTWQLRKPFFQKYAQEI